MATKIKLTLALFLITAVSFFSGCKKDVAQPTAGLSLVKSETTTSPSGIAYTVTYAYDSSGRQLKSQDDTTVTSYVYTTDSIFKTISLAGHYFYSSYAINAAGRITSDTKGFVYSYDNNGYLTGLSYTAPGNADSIVYTISGGNVVSAVEHQTDSATNNLVTTTYTYLSTKDTRNYGMASMGNPNTNLINAESITQIINGSTYTASYTYTYTYDAQGRVSQQVRSSGTSTYTTSYSY